MNEDTDGDCIKDGDEWEFAASVLGLSQLL